MDGLTRTSGAPRRSTDLNRRTSLDVSLACACSPLHCICNPQQTAVRPLEERGLRTWAGWPSDEGQHASAGSASWRLE